MLKLKKLKLLLVALSVLLLVIAFISGCGKDDAKPQMATQPAQTAQTDQSRSRSSNNHPGRAKHTAGKDCSTT